MRVQDQHALGDLAQQVQERHRVVEVIEQARAEHGIEPAVRQNLADITEKKVQVLQPEYVFQPYRIAVVFLPAIDAICVISGAGELGGKPAFQAA
jgi:hypothetical protein